MRKPRHLPRGFRDKHRLYSTWKSMRSRCNNPNVDMYRYYGGKGIQVCDEWAEFWVFVDDMYPSFIEGLTLDRIDNNKGYCKENCKWSTKFEQATNQGKSLKLMYLGELYTEAQLSRQTGVGRTTIQTRRKRGATVEEMVHGFK